MKMQDPYLKLVKPGICPFCHHVADDTDTVYTDEKKPYVYRCINKDCPAYNTTFSVPKELLFIIQTLQDMSKRNF